MKLWGGNYEGGPDRQFWEFNRSFPFDRRLLREEIAASRAWVRALGRCDALRDDEVTALDGGLAEILAEVGEDPGAASGDDEDVHSFVERRLAERVGDLAGQAHLGRSRNEQTVTALRLWVRGAIDSLQASVGRLVAVLVEQGRGATEVVLPGYTHARPAEPITFGHFAAAHAWALVRDHERLRDARVRVDVLPLGSGALAGTALPLDRAALAAELGFAAWSPSALDAVSDRDFAVEFVAACAQLQTHLSRLAEDLMRWSAPEVGFVTLPEAFTTGSSLMPQKKNPDALELIRAKAARVDGHLLALLTLLKGLPSGYQKDLQEDKEAVFDAADQVATSVAVMTGVISDLVLHPEAMRRQAAAEELMAAGLAVALAREGLPFRKAHGLVGAWVAEGRRTGTGLREAAARGLASVSPTLAERLATLFDPAAAVAAKAAPGGTAPAAVAAALDAALDRLRRE